MPRRFPDAPVVAVGVLLLDGDRVLLVQRGRPPQVGRWTVPGGGVEVGETLEEAALRELAEETGYRGDVNLERASLDVTRSPTGLVYWTFGGHVPTEFRVRLNPEHTDAGWFDVRALPRPLHPGVIRLFRRLRLG